MNTWVYIDAFNLYYGAVKGTDFRWLDVRRLSELLLPGCEIGRIKYFTASVSSRPNDPSKHVRQQVYLRALHTLPDLEIIFGHFLTHKVRMPLADCEVDAQQWVHVIKTEEKGSDVNLASHLLVDGYEDRYEQAVIMTNDSDLAEPVKMVHDLLGKPVGILNPQKHPSKVLRRHATFFKKIRTGVLRSSQFAERLVDDKGEFHKPAAW